MNISLDLLRKIQKITLFLLIITAPFKSIAYIYNFPVPRSDISNFFYVFAILLLVYEYFKFGLKVDAKAKFLLTFYTGWQLFCLIYGLLKYEFNHLLTVGQLPMVELLLNKMAAYGIYFDGLLAVKLWVLLKYSIVILFVNNTAFILCFYVYHLYGHDFSQAFQDIRKVLIYLLIIMGSYSFVELLWLKFNLTEARRFLEFVNPYLYEVERFHGWYPPLLWENQLRSILSEPSFLGTAAAFILPMLWSLLFEKFYEKIGAFIVFYFTLMLAATNARTAIVLTLGQILLLTIFVLYRRQNMFLKRFLVILGISLLAFYCNLIDFKSTDNSSASNYWESNVSSVVSTNARSNEGRFANLISNIITIKENPFTGVGAGLKEAYIDRNLPEFAYNNYEVRNWSRYIRSEGVLRIGYPAFNKYVDVTVQNGVLGLLLYLSVPLYLFYSLYKNWSLAKNDHRTILLIICSLGLFAAQLSNDSFLNYNGITWGLLFCKLAELKKAQEQA